MCKYHWRRSGSRFILEQFHSELITTSWYFPLRVYWNLLKDQIFVGESQSLNYEYQLWDTPGAEFCLFFFLYSRLCQPYIFLLLAAISVSMKKNLKSLSLIRYFNSPEGDWCREVHVTQFHPMRCERSLPGVFVGMISLRMKIGLSNNCLCFFR